jgi:hypothetical protein
MEKSSKKQKLARATLYHAGRIITHESKGEIIARRRGVPVLAAAAVIAAVGAGEFKRSVEEPYQSNVPAHVDMAHAKHLDTKIVPLTGAWGLAESVDPGHNPNVAIDHMEAQLGHYPEPGDTIAVEIPKKK